jgi:hypothetical protein
MNLMKVNLVIWKIKFLKFMLSLPQYPSIGYLTYLV